MKYQQALDKYIAERHWQKECLERGIITESDIDLYSKEYMIFLMLAIVNLS